MASEVETHPLLSGARTTPFSYWSLPVEEQQSSTSGPITTKDYAYDAYGHRVSMTANRATGTLSMYSYTNWELSQLY